MTITRLLLLRGCGNPLFGQSLRQKTVQPTAGAIDIYVAANRQRFYRSLGLFCLMQGSVWCVFGYYMLQKVNAGKPVSWRVLYEDLVAFNHHLAARLECFTPQAIKSAIQRPRKEAEASKSLTEVTKKASAMLGTDVKEFSKRVKLAIGLEPDDAQPADSISEATIRSRRFVPYLSFIMGAFTLFVGGVVPRRVIRRIQLLPWQEAEAVDPRLAVTTYGWFGTFPRRGSTLTAPMSAIRAAREGNKFMNVTVARRPFAFYLERSEAQFLLPEYFEHLTSTIETRRTK